jgi:hypothetical protein
MPGTSRRLDFVPGDWMSKPSRLLCVSRRLSLGENFLKIDPGDWIIIQATGSSFKNSLPDSVAWTHYPGAWIYVF